MADFIVAHPIVFITLSVLLVIVILHYATKNSNRSKELDIREKNLDLRHKEISARESKIASATMIEDIEAKKRSLEREQHMLQLRSDQITALEKELKKRESNLAIKEQRQTYISKVIKMAELNQQDELLTEREAHLNNLVRQRIADTVIDLSKRDYLSRTPVFEALRESADTKRLVSALSQKMHLKQPFNISSRIEGQSGELYDVTLSSCTCKDFALHKRPCKHMYRLAAEVGALLSYDTDHLEKQIISLQQKASMAEAVISMSERESAAAEKKKRAVQALLSETSQSYPWLAKLYADYFDSLDAEMEQRLRQKHPPALKAADEVSSIRREKRLLQKQNKLLEHQLSFYETLFPWLEDFKELSPEDAYRLQQELSNQEDTGTEYETLRLWLSPEEYQNLSNSEKYQLALERYQARPKTNWEIGIEYERYIGYLCEQAGYRVHYTGANLGLEDMGRDLILTKDDQCIVIQCKRWAQEKTIHEKHIFQLFGSCVLYELQHPSCQVRGAFVTTTQLSDTAKECAVRLNIAVHEAIPHASYPLIKCNISRNGEKIYHLPFDQQYDRVVIDVDKGEFFAMTVSEAENAGFRRAWRYRK